MENNNMSTTTFEEHIRKHVREYWSEHCGPGLGYCEMPEGYALMKSESCHFYWLRKDGVEGLVFYKPIGAHYSAVANKESLK